MNLNIKATNTTLTPAIREYIADKLRQIAKFIKEEDKVRVELEFNKKHNSGFVFRAEIDIQPHGHYADARGNDFYEALDLVIPKMKEQLSKKKDKKVSLRRRRTKIR